MSPVKGIGQRWSKREVVVFHGQRDSHIATGEDYETRTLGEIFVMPPGEADKGDGLAFIPSSYHDYDARNHAAQREKGTYQALTADIDTGDHPLERVKEQVKAFVGDAAWMIYSSPHARPGDMRWRAIIPLDTPTDFDTWHDAQNALFNFLEFTGIDCDRAMDRAGQPVFLPNVPYTHPKTGETLRDEFEPLFYQRATSGLKAPGLILAEGQVATGVDAIRRKRDEDEKERARIRKEIEAKRAARPQTEGVPIMADFNAGNSIATLLELYGYQQSPRNSDDWRSPHQTGESYATRVMGDKWVSLSMSDASARLGDTCATGCYGDAYDLFVHYEHGGDHKAAFRALYAERRATAPQTWSAPPPADPDDPGPGEEILDGPADPVEIAEASAEEVEGVRDDELLPVINPALWAGSHPPVRRWRMAGFMPDGQATLLTGAGASGKSLSSQQMATCFALGLPFLGIETAQCPTLYITCEDDVDELHRRQAAICEVMQASPASLDGRLFLLSLAGAIGNELATFTQEGEIKPAPRYHEIVRTCLALGIRHVTLDNTAHTFAGNENDRHQVAGYVNLQNAMAQAIGGSVLMVGHPNKAGDSYSGSTAWENQVRSRLYLETPKGEEGGAPINPDMRVLRNEKANYSQRGAEVTFYWSRGAFVLERDLPRNEAGEPIKRDHDDWEESLFLSLLERLTQQRRHVSHSANLSNYAPKVMASMPEAHGTSAGVFKRAMERLFAADLLVASQPLWKGSNRHPVLGLAAK